MTAGEGIFYSTILILVAIGAWRISVNKKWKLVLGIAASLIALSVLSIGGYYLYESGDPSRPPPPEGAIDLENPVKFDELWGIELGITKGAVTLAKGQPDLAGTTAGVKWQRRLKRDDVIDVFGYKGPQYRDAPLLER